MRDTSCQTLLLYNDTPVQQIIDETSEQAGVQLFMKREDLNHPYVSGNKWWKLKYNIEEAVSRGYSCVLTFGGAYSNHIYAVAAAAKETGLKSIGVIRGEKVLPLNSTLQFAQQQGMELLFISREAYRQKSDLKFLRRLSIQLGSYWLIPEGGTNAFAVRGVAEFARTLLHYQADYVCVPVGTGGTMAGLIEGLEGRVKILGFSVLKNGAFLKDEVASLLHHERKNWEIITDYDFGGYAKKTNELEIFINRFKQHHNIALEPVYTGKMMFGVMDMLRRNFFSDKTRVFVIHTGGIR